MPKRGTGKKGVEQRVKGNVKSANSSRMSELLGGSVSGVIGFDAVSSSGGGGGLAASADAATMSAAMSTAAKHRSLMSELVFEDSGRFQVVMKQLGKRDSTTKLKALQEFIVLTQHAPTDSTETVLSVWAVMYNKLSMDNDHRVRDVSHKALKAVVVAVKGALGAYLNSIIGCWVSGMSDPHTPSANSAHNAFSAAFPNPQKQVEVLQHTFKAIINHASQMILRLTPDTFSDPKVVPSDERVQRFERALGMSIMSLRIVFNQLPYNYLHGNKKFWEDLLTDKKLWKIAKHQNPSLRAAVYNLVPVLCQKVPDHVQSKGKLYCTAVLSSLGESEPTVIGPLWEAALMIVSETDTWNEHVNIEKALLPGMWSLMRAGGYGSARMSFPCLLPLLSRLVDKVYRENYGFAKKFLDTLKEGLQLDNPQILRGEFEILIRTFNECLLYLVTNLRLLPPTDNMFTGHAITLVVELVYKSLRKGPSLMQSEVIFSHSVKLIGKLLLLRDQIPTLRPNLSNFQLQLSKYILSILDESEEDIDDKFTRVGSFLKCFFSRALWNAMERKTVRFFSESDFPTQELEAPHRDSYSTVSKEDEALRDDATREFIAPTICSLCGNSIAAISDSVNLNHSHLLLTMTRLYADKVLIKSVYSFLESNHNRLIKEHRGDLEKALKKKLLTLCTILSRASRFEEGLLAHPKYTENVIEAMLVLLNCDLVNSESASMFLSELVKSFVPITPLILIKLGETGQWEVLELVIESCGIYIDSLLENLSQNASSFLWKMFDNLFTRSDSRFERLALATTSFRMVCQNLMNALQETEGEDDEGFPLTAEDLRNVFKVVGAGRASLIQDNSNDVMMLLNCIQHWCLYQHSDLALVQSAIRCYHSLLKSHPDPDLSDYIHSLPSLVTQGTTYDIQSTLTSAVLYFSLHCHILKNPANLIGLYEPMLKNVYKLKDKFFPISGLERFCDSSLLFSPIFYDMHSSCMATTLSPSLLTSLFPIVALIDPALLNDVNLFESHTSSTEVEGNEENSSKTLGDVLKGALGGYNVHVTIRSLLFGRSEDDVSEDTRKVLDRIARTLVSSLSLSSLTLQESSLKRNSLLETKLVQVLQSTFGSCLGEAVVNRCHEWVQSLVSELLNRMAVDGPVWLLVLHHLFVALDRCYMDDRESFQEVIRLVLDASDSNVIYSSLCSMERDIFHGVLMDKFSERGSDACFLTPCLCLMPDNGEMISGGMECLKLIAEKQSNSEMTLFDSLVESCQDPMVFTTLVLIRVLLMKNKIPEGTWDFVLCTLTTITQLVAETDVSCNVNLTVLLCTMLDFCHDISLYFASPHSHSEQSTEWEEFFQPALLECLLPLLMKRATSAATEYENASPCLVLQKYYLCRALSGLSLTSAPSKPVDLEELVVDVMVSKFYPQQVIAYQLSQRSLDMYMIHSEEDPPSSNLSKTPMKLKDLQEIFNKALEKINMDEVFMEDNSLDSTSIVSRTDDFYFDNVYSETTSYVFLWLIMTEAVGHCSPEVRVALIDWLKEQSLFELFLHGLFKYLNEGSGKQSSLTVTLHPSLEQLACVAYSAVAKHLPSMLRQWHLGLDRQTSTLVNRFTTKYVSPALQQAELQSISKSNTTIGNLEVHVYTGVSEVAVIYKVDEFSIELFVCLPDSYPLQPPSIREGKKVRMDAAQWRKWMLQLTIFVTNQNGSLMDGLLLWKNNLDKHFSGADDCMICFSVIHATNYSLPKMVCRTCKKKFHSACLYKWFSSSTKSSCPLCRNIF